MRQIIILSHLKDIIRLDYASTKDMYTILINLTNSFITTQVYVHYYKFTN